MKLVVIDDSGLQWDVWCTFGGLDLDGILTCSMLGRQIQSAIDRAKRHHLIESSCRACEKTDVKGGS